MYPPRVRKEIVSKLFRPGSEETRGNDKVRRFLIDKLDLDGRAELHSFGVTQQIEDYKRSPEFNE